MQVKAQLWSIDNWDMDNPAPGIHCFPDVLLEEKVFPSWDAMQAENDKFTIDDDKVWRPVIILI